MSPSFIVRRSLLIVLVLLTGPRGESQTLQGVRIDQGTISGLSEKFSPPAISFELDGNPFDARTPGPLALEFSESSPADFGFVTTIMMKNIGKDTVALRNVVPFGVGQCQVYITGKGDHPLSRAHLFQSGKAPVNVILPDNAWELGYGSMQLGDSSWVYGLARRDLSSLKQAVRRRFQTLIAPGGSVAYKLYVGTFKGNWQEGLREVFQNRKLFDVDRFDDGMFKREDLKWIRKAYVMHLLMAWDKSFYDQDSRRFTLPDFVKKGREVYGGDDVVCIWPTWPSLGIDQRNQFDLYRDLPGGLPALRTLSDTLHAMGTRFFIAYNPWDENTRKEEHLQGLADLIRATNADGVVLDTKGESSKELQAAADAVKPGVVMYSEGMAVPRDMTGIVSGRVHNALYYPPILNLNKLIMPEFAILRVAEVFKEPIRREFALSLFNGYGTEINQFAPGHPDWEIEQYKYLGRTTRILRESADVFSSGRLTPLITTNAPDIWVNQWTNARAERYTILSLRPEGYHQPLFRVKTSPHYHFFDLWHHEEVAIEDDGGDRWAVARLDAFEKSTLGTNNEGHAGCIARFPTAIHHTLSGNMLDVSASGDEVRIFAGNPSYENTGKSFEAGKLSVDLRELFGRHEGKFVVQLFVKDQIIDEVVLSIQPGTPRLISKATKTAPRPSTGGMVRVPAGSFPFKATNGDEFIPYPNDGVGTTHAMPGFLMDKHPVTNAEFKRFLEATSYKPLDTTNFLRHWPKGIIAHGQERYPVVYVSLEDAMAYATWAAKRLPTEREWQYAAQTTALNEWPWKQTRPVTRKQQYVTETLTVSLIEGIDPAVCNLGDGKLYQVGKYPKGANALGIQDLVGCVWQLTNDEYESGSYRYVIMKGGSYFKPSSSWWYVQSGPRELHYRQFLLRVSPGFERNGTVGFRCVAD